MTTEINQLTSERFLQILQDETEYIRFLEELADLQPISLPQPQNYKIIGIEAFNRRSLRPLQEDLPDKFICHLLSVKKSYMHGYEQTGLNSENLNYMIKAFPLWIKWVEADTMDAAVDFLEAMTTIQQPSKEEINETLSHMSPLPIRTPEQKEKFRAAALLDHERLCQIAALHPPFSVQIKID